MNSGTGTTERTDVGAAVVFEAGRKRMRRCDFSTGKGGSWRRFACTPSADLSDLRRGASI